MFYKNDYVSFEGTLVLVSSEHLFSPLDDSFVSFPTSSHLKNTTIYLVNSFVDEGKDLVRKLVIHPVPTGSLQGIQYCGVQSEYGTVPEQGWKPMTPP